MDVQAYLERIQYTGPLEVSPDVLRALHRAHLAAVPFENLDIHLGIPILLDRHRLFGKIVVNRRGGFCYELNGLFAELLGEIGFPVEMLSAGVAKETGGFGPEFDHMTLLVRLERPWLADVGFGECFRDPLPLAESSGNSYRLTCSRERWTLLNGLSPQYTFTLQPRRFAEFAGMCHFHQTSPQSSFTRNRITTLATPNGRITLSDRKLIVSEGELRTFRLLEPEECRETLQRRFGIELPWDAYLRGIRAVE